MRGRPLRGRPLGGRPLGAAPIGAAKRRLTRVPSDRITPIHAFLTEARQEIRTEANQSSDTILTEAGGS